MIQLWRSSWRKDITDQNVSGTQKNEKWFSWRCGIHLINVIKGFPFP